MAGRGVRGAAGGHHGGARRDPGHPCRGGTRPSRTRARRGGGSARPAVGCAASRLGRVCSARPHRERVDARPRDAGRRIGGHGFGAAADGCDLRGGGRVRRSGERLGPNRARDCPRGRGGGLSRAGRRRRVGNGLAAAAARMALPRAVGRIRPAVCRGTLVGAPPARRARRRPDRRGGAVGGGTRPRGRAARRATWPPGRLGAAAIGGGPWPGFWSAAHWAGPSAGWASSR